jgi:hypothetical protein
MGKGARVSIAMGLGGVAVAACSALAGIEDLQLTGSTDGAPDTTGATGDASADTGGSNGGGEGGSGGDTGSADSHLDSGSSSGGEASVCVDGSCPDASTDCPGGFLLCDGFENGSLDTAIWSATNNDARQSIGVDNTAAHRGSYALHVHSNAVTGSAYVGSHIWEFATFPSTLLYIRAFYSLSALPGTDSNPILSLVSAANGTSARGMVGFQQSGLFFSTVTNTADASDSYTHYSTTPPIPHGASPRVWTCIELEIDTSYAAPNPNGLLQVWHDSTTVDPSLVGPAKLQPLLSAMFGLDESVPPGLTTTPVDLFIDDIAIDSKFIDCSQ